MQPNIFTSSTSSMPVRPILETYWVIPARFLAGEYPGVTFSPDVTRRRLNAFLQAGFDTLINLTGEGEVEDYAGSLRELALARGQTVECMRFPMGDFGLPTLKTMTEILDAIDAALTGGRKVYVHCYGGIGRTGTTVGCYLVRHGLSGQQALQQLAAWWQGVPKSARFPHSPETIQQEKFVLEWQVPKK